MSLQELRVSCGRDAASRATAPDLLPGANPCGWADQDRRRLGSFAMGLGGNAAVSLGST